MTQILAYVIVLAYGVFQEIYIRDRSARSFRYKTKLDRTTVFYVSGIALCLVGAPILNSIDAFALSRLVTWISIVVLIAGCALRALAMRQLGKFYTCALSVATHQTLMTTGLYSYIRHPGYAGTILAGLGFGLAQGNLLTLLFILLVLICIYTVRIHNEEKILLKAFGKRYKEYASRTKRLIPFLF